jgi:signal peptidase I
VALASTIGRWTAGLLAGLAVLAVLAYVGLFAAGYRPVAVYSGSMVPTIPVGGLAFVKPTPSSSVRPGDVITFSDPYVPGRIVTHRIVRIIPRSGRPAGFRTKGDANLARDPWTVELPGRVGLYRFNVPYAGYALVYARTREVRTLLILISTALFLGLALRAIWKPSAVVDSTSGASS